MRISDKVRSLFHGHRILIMVILCLFGLSMVQSRQASKKKPRKKVNERVYLIHSDVLRYDMFGDNPTAQVLVGNVAFKHKGVALL